MLDLNRQNALMIYVRLIVALGSYLTQCEMLAEEKVAPVSKGNISMIRLQINKRVQIMPVKLNETLMTQTKAPLVSNTSKTPIEKPVNEKRSEIYVVHNGLLFLHPRKVFSMTGTKKSNGDDSSSSINYHVIKKSNINMTGHLGDNDLLQMAMIPKGVVTEEPKSDTDISKARREILMSATEMNKKGNVKGRSYRSIKRSNAPHVRSGDIPVKKRHHGLRRNEKPKLRTLLERGRHDNGSVSVSSDSQRKRQRQVIARINPVHIHRPNKQTHQSRRDASANSSSDKVHKPKHIDNVKSQLRRSLNQMNTNYILTRVKKTTENPLYDNEQPTLLAQGDQARETQAKELLQRYRDHRHYHHHHHRHHHHHNHHHRRHKAQSGFDSSTELITDANQIQSIDPINEYFDRPLKLEHFTQYPRFPKRYDFSELPRFPHPRMHMFIYPRFPHPKPGLTDYPDIPPITPINNLDDVEAPGFKRSEEINQVQTDIQKLPLPSSIPEIAPPEKIPDIRAIPDIPSIPGLPNIPFLKSIPPLHDIKPIRPLDTLRPGDVSIVNKAGAPTNVSTGKG